MNDERIPQHRTRGQEGAPGPRRAGELDRAEALRLLDSICLGRIVFSQNALPAIRPVNHMVDEGDVIIRTHVGAVVATHGKQADAPGTVVAYEADAIDPVTQLGWSVVATGHAQLITDAIDLARFEAMLHPWVARQMAYTVRIHPDLVTGIRLIEAA
ncbi:pyridoxamine 5'-phosphate oxidase family protein [Streptomyces sp. NPDC101225]|uniref:pyridoxamine 5'-phosphate oxidase family protein n=1 Tax=Streptomyces sp. NPDC101225 TaxID=3366135 RepID=UPI0037F15EE8